MQNLMYSFWSPRSIQVRRDFGRVLVDYSKLHSRKNNTNVRLTYSFEESPFTKLNNCSKTVVRCDTDFDCFTTCENGAQFTCKNAQENGSYNICTKIGQNFEEKCNADHGGISSLHYDENLNRIAFSCTCTESDFWTGPTCDEPNPYRCRNGQIYRTDSGQWGCKCTDADDNLLRIRKFGSQLGTEYRYMCTDDVTTENLLSADPYQVSLIEFVN